jgi:hypothetical protein
MARNARRRIEEHYTWERVATLASAAFSTVAREAAAPVPRR